MIHSLRFRLLMAFTLAIVIVIVITILFISLRTRSEINQFQERGQFSHASRVEQLLSDYYLQSDSWDGVQPFVVQIETLRGQRIVLTDGSGTVIADSENKILGTTYQPELPASDSQPQEQDAPFSPGHVLFLVGIGPIGTVYVFPMPPADVNSPQTLLGPISGVVLWGGLVAIVAAIVISFFLSRQILAPIKALTKTANRLGKGDFSQRVTLKSKGEVGELAQAFNSMADNLQRAEKLRRNMVADVAHELRTPITNLSGYLEAIGDGVVAPDAATISSLSEESASLSRLVDELQELSLAEAGELKLDRQTDDIARLIEQTAAVLQPQATAKGLSLVLNLPEKLPSVSIDTHRIRQVLNNLLKNAVAHTGQGGTITVTAWQEGSEIKFSVADTGEGIPPDDLPNIFERFYRVDKSRARATGGSGLGLTIAKRLVEAHGGRIEAASQPGKGSLFTVTLPLNN
jgi:signal transduction histidine kinase